MKTKNYLMVLLLMLFLGTLFHSCFSGRPLERTYSDNNEEYKVDYLFEHDGCRVYRFKDKGNYVYFTNCNGDVTSIVNDSTVIYVHGSGSEKNY